VRTGPIGRAARLAWGVVAAVTVVSLVDERGPARFRNPHVLTEPAAWLLHVLSVVIFVLFVGVVASALGGRHVARRWQVGSLVALAVVVVVAGGIGQLNAGAAWGFPLADLVWIFDVTVLASEVLAFALAVVLGTSGCEIGVWGKLLARARHSPAPRTDVLACIVGLHLIDRWEAARRSHG